MMLQEYDHDKSDGDALLMMMMMMMVMMLVVMVQSASATKWEKYGSTVNPVDKHKKCTISAKHLPL